MPKMTPYEAELAQAKDRSHIEQLIATRQLYGMSKFERQAARNSWLFIAVIGFLIGGIMLLAGLSLNNDFAEKEKKGVAIEAMADEVWLVTGRRFRSHYEVQYSYEVEGKTYRGRSTYSHRISPGDSLNVKYLPDAPGKSFIPGEGGNPTFLLFFFASIFLVPAGLSFYKYRLLATPSISEDAAPADISALPAKSTNLPPPDVMPGASVMPTSKEA